MRTYELEEILPVLRAVIEENPDRQVEQCLYTYEDGSPCCVVGYVFDRLGITRPEHGVRVNSKPIGGPFMTAWLEASGVDFSNDAEQLLTRAQIIQDKADGLYLVDPDHPGAKWSNILKILPA